MQKYVFESLSLSLFGYVCLLSFVFVLFCFILSVSVVYKQFLYFIIFLFYIYVEQSFFPYVNKVEFYSQCPAKRRLGLVQYKPSFGMAMTKILKDQFLHDKAQLKSP